jgi:hypothetical protein
MTPLLTSALVLLVVSVLGLAMSGARLMGVRVPNPFRRSQRPTFRAPNIPVEFERGEWETIP